MRETEFMKRITREEIACELGRLLADQAILPHRGMTLPGATITVECNAQRIPKTNLGDLEICLVPVGPMEGENAELLAVERKVCESLLTDSNPGVQQGAKERLSRLALPPVEKGALAGHKLELRQQRTKREAVLTQTTDEQGVALFKLVVLDTPCELSIAVAEVWVGRGTTPVPRVTTKGRTDGLPSVEVSLLALHKGAWRGPFVLDNRSVSQITSYLDDAEPNGEPGLIANNAEKSFQGSIVLGKGFLLEPNEAAALIAKDGRNRDILFPYLNGEDLNSYCDQSPSRWVINFFDWSEERAQDYQDCYAIIATRVRPERTRKDEQGNFKLRKPLPQKWWIYADKRPKLYRTLQSKDRVIAIAEVTKYCLFSFVPTGFVYMHTLKLITQTDYATFIVLNSSIHEYWAWKYSSTMRNFGIRYTPSTAFETFPFPSLMLSELKQIGEHYHEHRRELMLKLQLGLTKTYNLFHDRELSVELVAKESKQPVPVAESAHADLRQLRALHVQMDQTVLAAYGWHQPSDAGPALALRHDFYEVDYLPENDRTRYTIHPDARKEILKRLLQLNHQLYAEEEAKGLHKPKKGAKKGKAEEDGAQETLL